uniref:Large ribosomal subunit protein uL10-like insertion domain-containing protein n=1 Tax=Spumella elongata TaxID=89044 RepID=A0A7S3H0N5_9STRA|mmetsp:Transcript_2934/g.4907  ORF Transcript_2934/g.4907 Transcript_2934/m.4907 type:complete len:216 (+) Transcript_2934:69-716(+)
MARSKRNKIVSLTKTDAKGKDLKKKLVEVLRSAVDEYKGLYVLNFENMRAAKFREIRMDWKESKIFMGKNSIAQIALGRNPEEEYKDNLRHISKKLEGSVGLLFTNRKKDEVLKYFKNYAAADFAKAGAIPTEEIVLQPGVLDFPVTMLDTLRKLGMVVEVDDGTVVLRSPITISSVGVPLTPEQAKILVKLDTRTIDFKVKVEASWENGKFKEY